MRDIIYGKRDHTITEFDGYQELMNWTSAGSESSVSLTVDGDTDMEYVIETRNLTGQNILLRLNNDSTANKYGYQFLRNNAGTIEAARGTTTSFFAGVNSAVHKATLSTINGFLKFDLFQQARYVSGTNIDYTQLFGMSYNSTDNITSLDFICNSGNFTAGTNIRVLGRREK